MKSKTLKLVVSAKNENILTNEEREREYRRGFRDGWVIAIDANYDLMFKSKMTREAAYNKLWNHWEKGLWDWLHGDCSAMIMPPGSPLGDPIT